MPVAVNGMRHQRYTASSDTGSEDSNEAQLGTRADLRAYGFRPALGIAFQGGDSDFELDDNSSEAAAYLQQVRQELGR